MRFELINPVFRHTYIGPKDIPVAVIIGNTLKAQLATGFLNNIIPDIYGAEDEFGIFLDAFLPL